MTFFDFFAKKVIKVTKIAAEKWHRIRRNKVLGFLLFIGVCYYYGFVELPVYRLVSSCIIGTMAALFWNYTERGFVEIDGEKYRRKEFQIYQVRVGGNLSPFRAGLLCR